MATNTKPVVKRAPVAGMENTAIVCHFVKERETKNKVVYQEVVIEGVVPVIGQLYVSKSHAKDAQTWVVTLSH